MMKSQPRILTCCCIEWLLAARFDFHPYHGQPSFLPRVPSPEEGGRVLDSVSIHVQHRTGARMLVLSSTVGNQELLRGKISESQRQLAQRNVDRSRDVALVVRLLRADVDVDSFPGLHHLHRLIARDSARLG